MLLWEHCGAEAGAPDPCDGADAAPFLAAAAVAAGGAERLMVAPMVTIGF